MGLVAVVPGARCTGSPQWRMFSGSPSFRGEYDASLGVTSTRRVLPQKATRNAIRAIPRGSRGADDCSLADVLPGEYVKRHLAVADALASAVIGEPVVASLVARVPEIAGLPLADLLAQADDVPDCTGDAPDSSGALHAGGILCTSLAGCKGLSANHVFLVGMNDGHLPYKRASITDDEVCQLIVALSRSRKSCTLVSTGRFGGQTPARSVFVDWLSPLFEGYKYSRNGLEALGLQPGAGP